MRYRYNQKETVRFLQSQTAYDIIRPTTEAIADQARELAPVRSGSYRDSIQTAYQLGYPDDWGEVRATGRVWATAPYAAAVEWGNEGNAEHDQHTLVRAAQQVSST